MNFNLTFRAQFQGQDMFLVFGNDTGDVSYIRFVKFTSKLTRYQQQHIKLSRIHDLTYSVDYAGLCIWCSH